METAIILAAGLGTRLRGAESGPKALLAMGGETLLARSLRLLRAHGITRTVVVVGYARDAFARAPGVELVENPHFADTGTFVSLGCALDRVETDFLLLEGDLFYEERALALLLADERPDVILGSGFTGAGDEVWIGAAEGRLRALSKDRAAVGVAVGELVGISRITAKLASLLRDEPAHPRASYETDVLAAVSARHPVGVRIVPDLLWGEIDDPAQYRRVRDVVVPALFAQRGAAGPERVLFTPGPLTTSRGTKAVMLRDVGSRDHEFLDVVARVRRGLLAVAGTAEPLYAAVPVQGSGTFALEAVLGSVVPRSGRLLVLANGTYGERLARIARALSLDLAVIQGSDLEPLDPAAVADALFADPAITTVAAVHCETSTGLLNPVAAIGAVVARAGRTFVVDAMSSFGGVPLGMDADYLVSSPNKCLQGVPGFAFVVARRAHLLAAGPPRSLSLDLRAQLLELDASGQFRFTPPTHAILACDEALRELWAEGGVAARAARYQRTQAAIAAGLAALGFLPLLAPAHQSGIITAFRCPEAFDFAAAYEGLAARGYVIYPGSPGKGGFRVGSIGQIGTAEVEGLLAAFADVLR